MSEDHAPKQIALYGGSFDPPHNGHIISITHLLNSEKIDEVWLIPSGDGRYDKAPVEKAADRMALLEVVRDQVFHGAPRLKIVDYQLDSTLGTSYTIDLVERITGEHSDTRFYFVIGADNVSGLPDWKEFDRLQTLVTFLIVPRLGEEHDVELPAYVEKLSETPLASFSLSSSELRKALQEGKSVIGSLPEPVFMEIERRRLYR